MNDNPARDEDDDKRENPDSDLVERGNHETCAMTPNDPKLSDGGAWRGACPTVARTTDAKM